MVKSKASKKVNKEVGKAAKGVKKNKVSSLLTILTVTLAVIDVAISVTRLIHLYRKK